MKTLGKTEEQWYAESQQKKRNLILNQVQEKEFQNTILTMAKAFHWEPYHTWYSIHSPAGFPDLFLCRPPRIVMAELKKQFGQLSENQVKWIEMLRQCPGVEVYIWRPSDWPEIEKILI